MSYTSCDSLRVLQDILRDSIRGPGRRKFTPWLVLFSSREESPSFLLSHLSPLALSSRASDFSKLALCIAPLQSVLHSTLHWLSEWPPSQIWIESIIGARAVTRRMDRRFKPKWLNLWHPSLRLPSMRHSHSMRHHTES